MCLIIGRIHQQVYKCLNTSQDYNVPIVVATRQHDLFPTEYLAAFFRKLPNIQRHLNPMAVTEWLSPLYRVKLYCLCSKQAFVLISAWNNHHRTHTQFTRDTHHTTHATQRKKKSSEARSHPTADFSKSNPFILRSKPAAVACGFRIGSDVHPSAAASAVEVEVRVAVRGPRLARILDLRVRLASLRFAPG